MSTTTEGESSADNLTIADSGSVGITRSGTSNSGHIFFSDATSGVAETMGIYCLIKAVMAFGTVSLERMRMDSGGRILIEMSGYGNI